MALIRVNRFYGAGDDMREDEIILNTAHITVIYQDPQGRGAWVQLVKGDPILVKLNFEDIWTLIQRET